MKLYRYLNEMKLYKQAWPDFKYLIHQARSAADRESIMKNGFELGRNPKILKGVYTRPLKWMRPGEIGDVENGLQIMTRPDAKIFDNGCERPMDALFGNSESPAFRKVYKQILKELGFKIKTLNQENGGRTDTERNRFVDNWDAREKFMIKLYDWLKTNGYSIYINGGEVIIINPKDAIAPDGVRKM